MQMPEPFQLDVVSVRLVKNAPLFSDKKITTPEDAASLLGELLCEMDRAVKKKNQKKTGNGFNSVRNLEKVG